MCSHTSITFATKKILREQCHRYPSKQLIHTPQDAIGSIATPDPTSKDTPSPTKSTTPATSCPGTPPRGPPLEYVCKSLPQIPTPATRIRNHPGGGTNSCRSSRRISRVLPLHTAAFFITCLPPTLLGILYEKRIRNQAVFSLLQNLNPSE